MMKVRPVPRVSVTVDLDPEVHAYLLVLARANYGVADSVPELLRWLARCAADGMRRPGSWERGWLVQACGDEWEQLLEQVPELPYRQLRVPK